MKGKVCHITTVHPVLDIRIFEKECISLARNGWEVHLLAPNTSSRNERGVHIHGIDFSSENRWLRMINRPKAMLQAAIEIDADIYHFHDPEFLLQARKLLRLGKKVIYDVHEDVPRQILGKPYLPAWSRPIIARCFEMFENRVVKKLSFIITATDAISERFLAMHSHVATVFNYPILREIQSVPEWKDRETAVVYVGGVTAIRGIRELVKAIELLPEDIKLHIAGAISPAAFESEIKSLSGWRKVVYHGTMDRSAIVQLLTQSKVGLVTLYPQINYLDSMPIKLFEYALAGLPVVASNFPFWNQLVSEIGIGLNVDPRDPEDIANAIQYLLSNEEIACNMGLQGRKMVIERLNWEQQEKILLECYQGLI